MGIKTIIGYRFIGPEGLFCEDCFLGDIISIWIKYQDYTEGKKPDYYGKITYYFSRTKTIELDCSSYLNSKICCIELSEIAYIKKENKNKNEKY